jgi:hypothetical protein
MALMWRLDAWFWGHWSCKSPGGTLAGPTSRRRVGLQNGAVQKTGNLKLSVNGSREGVYATEQDPQVMAFKSVLVLAGVHRVHAANGGMQSDGQWSGRPIDWISVARRPCWLGHRASVGSAIWETKALMEPRSWARPDHSPVR